MIDQEPGAMKSLKDELTLLKAEKEGLLLSSGYPADYLKMHYTCPECKDTGYIGRKNAIAFTAGDPSALFFFPSGSDPGRRELFPSFL